MVEIRSVRQIWCALSIDDYSCRAPVAAGPGLNTISPTIGYGRTLVDVTNSVSPLKAPGAPRRIESLLSIHHLINKRPSYPLPSRTTDEARTVARSPSRSAGSSVVTRPTSKDAPQRTFTRQGPGTQTPSFLNRGGRLRSLRKWNCLVPVSRLNPTPSIAHPLITTITGVCAFPGCTQLPPMRRIQASDRVAIGGGPTSTFRNTPVRRSIRATLACPGASVLTTSVESSTTSRCDSVKGPGFKPATGIRLASTPADDNTAIPFRPWSYTKSEFSCTARARTKRNSPLPGPHRSRPTDPPAPGWTINHLKCTVAGISHDERSVCQNGYGVREAECQLSRQRAILPDWYRNPGGVHYGNLWRHPPPAQAAATRAQRCRHNQMRLPTEGPPAIGAANETLAWCV